MELNQKINLIKGDVLSEIKNINNESIDLIVTDPPYLINYKSNHRKNKQHKFCNTIKNDNNYDLISEYLKECYRILKNNTAMYIFCSYKRLDFFKQEIEKVGFNIKNMIIWVKNNHTAGDLYSSFGHKYEILFLLNKGRKKFNGERLTDIWFFDRVSGKKQLHQNQKPLELIEQCILKHSNENDIIFDGFAGSGTTAIACLNTNRNFIGCELDSEYYKVAKTRIDKWKNYKLKTTN